MGQALRKRKPGDQTDQQQKQELELQEMIEGHLNDNYKSIENSIEDIGDFYHAIQDIVEKLSEKKGAMQFRTPTIERLKKEVDAVLAKRKSNKKDFPLTKEEVKDVIQRVISIDRFHIGQASRDIFLYIFGIPVAGLIAKRIIPGPTRSIPDELFIPAITSGTVLILAKTNRL